MSLHFNRYNEEEIQNDIEESSNRVEFRLLRYGKKYEDKKHKLKESYYQEIMKSKPQITKTQVSSRGNSVFDRLYAAQNKNQSEIEKIVTNSKLRVPLNDLIKSGNNCYKEESKYYEEEQQQSQMKVDNLQHRYLGSTYSQTQKLRPVRQYSFQNSRTLKQSHSEYYKPQNSIIKLSMDLFERKQRLAC